MTNLLIDMQLEFQIQHFVVPNPMKKSQSYILTLCTFVFKYNETAEVKLRKIAILTILTILQSMEVREWYRRNFSTWVHLNWNFYLTASQFCIPNRVSLSQIVAKMKFLHAVARTCFKQTKSVTVNICLLQSTSKLLISNHILRF